MQTEIKGSLTLTGSRLESYILYVTRTGGGTPRDRWIPSSANSAFATSPSWLRSVVASAIVVGMPLFFETRKEAKEVSR